MIEPLLALIALQAQPTEPSAPEFVLMETTTLILPDASDSEIRLAQDYLDCMASMRLPTDEEFLKRRQECLEPLWNMDSKIAKTIDDVDVFLRAHPDEEGEFKVRNGGQGSK